MPSTVFPSARDKCLLLTSPLIEPGSSFSLEPVLSVSAGDFEKYLTRITLVDSLKHIRDGLGGGSPSAGYSWYVGI